MILCHSRAKIIEKPLKSQIIYDIIDIILDNTNMSCDNKKYSWQKMFSPIKKGN